MADIHPPVVVVQTPLCAPRRDHQQDPQRSPLHDSQFLRKIKFSAKSLSPSCLSTTSSSSPAQPPQRPTLDLNLDQYNPYSILRLSLLSSARWWAREGGATFHSEVCFYLVFFFPESIALGDQTKSCNQCMLLGWPRPQNMA